jgi:hypothetical protein
MSLYVVYGRQGQHLRTTADWLLAQRLRIAFRGRIVTVLRQPTIRDIYQELQVAA